MATPRQTKTRALWSGAITVGVLALVLVVLGMMSPLFKAGKSEPPAPAAISTITTTPQSATSLYNEALSAELSGDTTRAIDLASQALAADPSNTAAKQLLDKLKSSGSSGSNGSSNDPTSTSPGGSTQPTAPVSVYLTSLNLASLVPTALAGYTLDLPVQVGRDITRSATPDVRNSPVRQISWSVHDLKTAAAAKSFITKTSKGGFPHDADTVQIGTSSAYFGTDGTQVATVAFVRGRYVFEVLGAARDVSPVLIKSAVVAAAKAYKF